MSLRALSSSLLTMGLLLGGLNACTGSQEPVPTPETNPPEPEPITRADYRTVQLCLSQGDGLDVDGDGTADNNLPLLLDELYASLEEAVLTSLAESSTNPELVWQVLSEGLERSGLPVSAQSYCETLDASLQAATLNVLATFSVQPDYMQGVFQSADASAEGLVATGRSYADLRGTGTLWVELGPGSFVIPYPQSWFTLPLLQAHLTAQVSTDGLSAGQLSGGVLLESLVQAVLAPVPDSITIGDSTIEIPKELLVAQLTELLADAENEAGEPLCDLEVSGTPAISALYLLTGVPVQVVQ